MQKVFKKFHPLQWIAAVLFASILFVACNNGESKKAEEPVEVKKDSLPAVDHDSLIKDKPETILNKPPGQ